MFDPLDELLSFDTTTDLFDIGAWPGLRLRPGPVGGFPGDFVRVNPCQSLSIAAGTANLAYTVPFDLAEPMFYDQLLFEITVTGAPGAVARGGVWNDDGMLLKPGTLRHDLGTVATETIGVKALTIPAELPRGRVWFTVVPQVVNNGGFRYSVGAYRQVPTPVLTNLALQFYLITFPAGAFPGTHPAIVSANSVAIEMALRVG